MSDKTVATAPKSQPVNPAQADADGFVKRMGGGNFDPQKQANSFAERLGQNPSGSFAQGMAAGKETLAQKQPEPKEIEGRERRSLINDSGAVATGAQEGPKN